MKRLLLFTFGIPLIVALTIQIFFGVFALFQEGMTIDILKLSPYILMFSFYIFFVPALFVGVVASLLRYQNGAKNLLFLIVFVICVGICVFSIYYDIDKFESIPTIFLWFFSSFIVGYWVFLKNKQKVN